MLERPAHSRASAERESRFEFESRYDAERTRQVRGLLLLAIAAIAFAILRAGVKQTFNPGWWRLW